MIIVHFHFQQLSSLLKPTVEMRMENNSLVTTQHENIRSTSAVRGYHVYQDVYQDVWKLSIGEKLVAKQEFDNPIDKHAVNSPGQLIGRPFAHELSEIAWYFLAHTGEISVEVSVTCR